MSMIANIHRMASAIIPRRGIKYRMYSGMFTDEFGISKPRYTEWHRILAHVEPGIVSSFGGSNIDEKMYHEFGLDFSKRTVTVWASGADLRSLARKDAPDQVEVDGSKFNIIHVSDFLEFNGWKRVYCEEVLDEREDEESS